MHRTERLLMLDFRNKILNPSSLDDFIKETVHCPESLMILYYDWLRDFKSYWAVFGLISFYWHPYDVVEERHWSDPRSPTYWFGRTKRDVLAASPTSVPEKRQLSSFSPSSGSLLIFSVPLEFLVSSTFYLGEIVVFFSFFINDGQKRKTYLTPSGLHVNSAISFLQEMSPFPLQCSCFTHLTKFS